MGVGVDVGVAGANVGIVATTSTPEESPVAVRVPVVNDVALVMISMRSVQVPGSDG